MILKFVFQAGSDGEAATLASQQTISVARQRGIDSTTVSIVSTKRIGNGRYESDINVPDVPKTSRPEPPKSTKPGLIFGSVSPKAKEPG